MEKSVRVRVASGFKKTRAADILGREWGEPIVVRNCQIFLAGNIDGIAAVSHDEAPFMELVAINGFVRGKGVSSALVEAIVAFASALELTAIRLTTTNDNVDALRFYQRRGFQLTALRPGAVNESRRLKPTIPINGSHGIPIRDELDLVRLLRSTS